MAGLEPAGATVDCSESDQGGGRPRISLDIQKATLRSIDSASRQTYCPVPRNSFATVRRVGRTDRCCLRFALGAEEGVGDGTATLLAYAIGYTKIYLALYGTRRSSRLASRSAKPNHIERA